MGSTQGRAEVRAPPGSMVSHPEARAGGGAGRCEGEAGRGAARSTAVVLGARPLLVRGAEPQELTPLPHDVGATLRRLPQLPRPRSARGSPAEHALPPL